jgi:hypothetical protein
LLDLSEIHVGDIIQVFVTIDKKPENACDEIQPERDKKQNKGRDYFYLGLFSILPDSRFGAMHLCFGL